MLKAIARGAHAHLRAARSSSAGSGCSSPAFFLTEQWSIVVDDGPADAMADMTAVDGFSVFVGTIVVDQRVR